MLALAARCAGAPVFALGAQACLQNGGTERPQPSPSLSCFVLAARHRRPRQPAAVRRVRRQRRAERRPAAIAQPDARQPQQPPGVGRSGEKGAHLHHLRLTFSSTNANVLVLLLALDCRQSWSTRRARAPAASASASAACTARRVWCRRRCCTCGTCHLRRRSATWRCSACRSGASRRSCSPSARTRRCSRWSSTRRPPPPSTTSRRARAALVSHSEAAAQLDTAFSSTSIKQNGDQQQHPRTRIRIRRRTRRASRAARWRCSSVSMRS